MEREALKMSVTVGRHTSLSAVLNTLHPHRHLTDYLNRPLSYEILKASVKDIQVKIKSILIIFCDGGSDENARYPVYD